MLSVSSVTCHHTIFYQNKRIILTLHELLQVAFGAALDAATITATGGSLSAVRVITSARRKNIQIRRGSLWSIGRIFRSILKFCAEGDLKTEDKDSNGERKIEAAFGEVIIQITTRGRVEKGTCDMSFCCFRSSTLIGV